MSTEQSSNRSSRVLGVIKTVVSVVFALAGLGLFLAWMGGAFHEKVPPGRYEVEKPSSAGRSLVAAERTVGPELVTAVGSVQSRRKSDIASQLLATIIEVKPRPGERVEAGSVLVVLDDRELLAQSREATASLAAAEADLVTRKSDFNRIKELRASGAASAEELNRVEGAYRVAETQVSRAKETISLIAVQLTYTKIVAGTGGIVSDRFVEPGDLATPGKPILTLYDPGDLELHVNVPESLASGVALGQKLGIRIDAINLDTEALVREVVPQAQQASRSVLVKLTLPQTSPTPILPGMYGKAMIPVGQVERVWVPQSAVIRRGQLDLVEAAGSDGTLTRRFVRIGRTVENKVEILAGLTPGEQVALQTP